MATAEFDTEVAAKWVSHAQASRVTRVSRDRLSAWAKEGLIEIRRLPGCKPLINMESVLKLIEEHTTPARNA